MRLAAAGLALGVLAACASEPSPPRTDEQVTVVWKRVDDPQAACQKMQGHKEVFAIRGCSKWNERDRRGQRLCTVFAPMPENEKDSDAFITLGHELMHCFNGNWHDRWGEMKPEEQAAAAGGSGKGADKSKPAAGK